MIRIGEEQQQRFCLRGDSPRTPSPRATETEKQVPVIVPLWSHLQSINFTVRRNYTGAVHTHVHVSTSVESQWERRHKTGTNKTKGVNKRNEV